MTFIVKMNAFFNVVLGMFWLFMFSILLSISLNVNALFSMFQICNEFNRVVGKNLSIIFLQALDQISPHMIEIFKKKTGTIGQKLNQLVQETKVSFTLVYFILFLYFFLSPVFSSFLYT